MLNYYRTHLSMGAGPAEPAPTNDSLAAKGESESQITWETFDTNLSMSASDDASVVLQRTTYKEHDAALGQELTSGRHEWTLTTVNDNANMYIGVATSQCDKRIYPAGTSAWAMHVHSGKLCSGTRYTRSNGRQTDVISRVGWAARKNPLWENRTQPVPVGAQVRAILDMDAGILSFAIGDGEPRVGFTNIPKEVHPYVCSGDKADNSRMIVSGCPKA